MSVGEPTDEKLVQDYVSKFYPKRYSGTGFLYHSRIVTRMLEGVMFRDGKRNDKILDVGCGNGFVSQLYPNHDVVGIDISDGMLAHNPYTWIKAPVEAIPFPDQTFDFVVCRSLLHHLEDPAVGLREMYRVLKPGGRWVCWETNFSLCNDLFRRLARLTPRFSHWHKNWKAQELIALIKSLHFQIVSVDYHGHLSYPLIAFPDILNLHLPLTLARWLIHFDDWLAHTPLAPLAWSVMIKTTK